MHMIYLQGIDWRRKRLSIVTFWADKKRGDPARTPSEAEGVPLGYGRGKICPIQDAPKSETDVSCKLHRGYTQNGQNGPQTVFCGRPHKESVVSCQLSCMCRK